MNRILPLCILIAFVYLLGSFFFLGAHQTGSESSLALGFIILAAYMAGEVFSNIKFPKITGYMFIGVLSGPQILGFMSKTIVNNLKLIDSIALGLIAFSAGREMKLESLRGLRRSITSITFWVTGTVACGVGSLVWYLSGWWAPLQIRSELRLPLALVFGLLAIAKSPLTTIALIDETGIRNRFSQTILGVVILKDVILIVSFSLVSGLLQHILNPGSVGNLEIILLLAWKLLGSLACGMLLGILITLYLRWVRQELGLFIVLLALLTTEAAHQLNLEPLLLCMSTGMFIENLSPEGKSFLESLKLSTPLIYTIFFAIVGAHLDILALQYLWSVVMLLLGVRIVLTQLGIYIGCRMGEDDPLIRRIGWLGLITQSGIALALAMLIEAQMPEIGKITTPVVLAMVAASDFLAPPLFKWALIKSRAGQSLD